MSYKKGVIKSAGAHQNLFSRIARGILNERIIKVKLPKSKEMLLWAKRGDDLIKTISRYATNNIDNGERRVTFLSEDGTLVKISLKEWEGREYIPLITIGSDEFDYIQGYVKGGFAIKNGVILGLDQIVGIKEIELRCDRDFEGIEEDIKLGNGKIHSDVRGAEHDSKKISLGCAGTSKNNSDEKTKVSDYDIWYGNGMKKVNEEYENELNRNYNNEQPFRAEMFFQHLKTLEQLLFEIEISENIHKHIKLNFSNGVGSITLGDWMVNSETIFTENETANVFFEEVGKTDYTEVGEEE